MTQRRIAGKIKGTEDFSALQKGLGIFKVLVIARFSNFLQKSHYFLSQCQQVQFFVDVHYVVTMS